jgi:hypothetical protein
MTFLGNVPIFINIIMIKDFFMDEFASQSQNCSKFVCNKSLRGIRFNKGYRDIAGDIASHHFKKASIPLKMYLKSFEILEKTSISQKKSSKQFKSL